MSEQKKTDAPEIGDNRICFRCIGEDFLSTIVRKDGEGRACSYCSKQGKTISIGELADHVEKAFEQHYCRTPNEASPMEYTMMKEGDFDWEREGQQAVYAIEEAAQIPGKAAEHVREVLGDRHYSIDEVESEFAEESHYEEDSVHDDNLWDDWSRFESSLKKEARLFNRAAEDLLCSLFGGLDNHATRNDKKVIVNAGPGRRISSLYRARVFQADDKLEDALKRPDLGLGPPPYAVASAGRMNARGIAVFYGATDAKVALAETRPPVGSRVLVGRFEITRPLKLLDVDAFFSIYVMGSVFDPTWIERLKKAKFLGSVSERITMPVMPDDEPFEYLITQAIADYLAGRTDPELDGIIYPSAQNNGKSKKNVVLFHKSARVAQLDIPKGTEITARLHDFDEDGHMPDYWVWEAAPPPDKKKKHDGDFPFPVSRLGGVTRYGGDVREPALRVVTESLQVHHVASVAYKVHEFSVKRHRSVKSKPKF